jgi:hypothetical protein
VQTQQVLNVPSNVVDLVTGINEVLNVIVHFYLFLFY